MAYEFGVGEYVDSDGAKCVVTEVFDERLFGRCLVGDEWLPMRWMCDGSDEDARNYRLLPPKQKRTVWANFYSEDSLAVGHGHTRCTIYGTRELADRNGSCNRIACKKVELEFTPGEGLE